MTTMETLLPTYRGSIKSTKLPIFQGKNVFSQVPHSGASSSISVVVKEERDTVKSRGLGLELLPLKTRSGRNKMAQGLPQASASIDHSNSGPLRALKALTRSK
jgi:hypothetical protein